MNPRPQHTRAHTHTDAHTPQFEVMAMQLSRKLRVTQCPPFCEQLEVKLKQIKIEHAHVEHTILTHHRLHSGSNAAQHTRCSMGGMVATGCSHTV